MRKFAKQPPTALKNHLGIIRVQATNNECRCTHGRWKLFLFGKEALV